MVTDRRTQLIEENLPLVHAVAARFARHGVEYEDLFQTGCVGLIKAVDHFDPSLGYKFSTYAVPVIMGEIKRLFRDGGTVKVSRSLKEKSLALQKLKERFEAKHMRSPTVGEMAQALACSPEEICEMENVLSPVLSLSGCGAQDDAPLEIPYDDSEKLFDRILLSQAVGRLQGEERQIVHLRYFEGKTQTETAGVLGISQVQVSRKEKTLLKKLKQLLK